jgi:hypothetical protein
LLAVGHHLDVIWDFDTLKQKMPNATTSEIVKVMECEYENKGYIKRNPNRKNATTISKVQFLKYERIIWKALGLRDANDNIQWRKITEICSLPDL